MLEISQDNITVNALWIGTKLSSSEILTIKSFLHFNHKFVLWAYDKIETPIPEGAILEDASKIIPREKVFCYKNANQFGHGKGSYAGFSDIFRYKLLYELGGWWTDMDVTCLRTLNFKNEFVFRTHHSLPLVGNIMKCPKGSELMKRCYQEATIKVDENNTDWHLPIQILVDNVALFKLDKYIIDFSNPDSWNLIRTFLQNEPNIPENWHVIHWVNEEWRRNKINRDYFIGKSLFYKLLEKYQIPSKKSNILQTIKLKFKLSRLGFAITLYINK